MASATTALSNLPQDVRILRLEALVEASETLNSASGLDEILHSILDLITAQLDCERATAFLRDERTGKLHARQMAGETQIEIVLEKGVGLAGYVAETGESLLINDVRADPRFDPSTDLRTGFVTKTMLCVPLRKLGCPVMGTLQAINARREGFSADDLAYLESFAAVAAVAVEREQLAQAALRAHLLSTELELARKIQQRLLPSSGSINLPQPFSAWGMSQACYDVGGDTYDVVMLPSGECAFWVADVSGKGIGAALLMTTLQTEMRALVRAERDLGRLAVELNKKVTEVAPLGTYATLFLGVLSSEFELLRYINAGHLPPIWMHKRLVEERRFEASGMPIGMLPGTEYEAGVARFVAGERLALFSDGVTDAENTAGRTFDFAGLEASLGGIEVRRACDIGQAFFADLDRFRIGAAAKDDTTFLVVGLD
ncbi:MAG: SpoIIE family protein phosphatase [Pyrinomonadaceae bacterium]|nr:SpoIIE family protein phosphatase [Pyrinomonadaceae bacterium]